jgi:hypothetical protein
MVEVPEAPDWRMSDVGLAVGQKSAGKMLLANPRVTPLLVPIISTV